MARNYKRDSRGRFSSGGGTGKAGKTGSGKTGKAAGGGKSKELTYEKSLQNLDRLKAAEKGKAKAPAGKTPANKIAASPRRLSAYEKAVADVMTTSKFKSDAKRMAELKRRGFPGDRESVSNAYEQVRRKLNVDPTKERKSAIRKYLGK